jgi:hypothetical protein
VLWFDGKFYFTSGAWDLYVITATTAFGVASAEPHGATRWRFTV